MIKILLRTHIIVVIIREVSYKKALPPQLACQWTFTLQLSVRFYTIFFIKKMRIHLIQVKLLNNINKCFNARDKQKQSISYIVYILLLSHVTKMRLNLRILQILLSVLVQLSNRRLRSSISIKYILLFKIPAYKR